jgi:hypothetical protein
MNPFDRIVVLGDAIRETAKLGSNSDPATTADLDCNSFAHNGPY